MIASIVLATEQGLGRLARDFYDNGLIQRVLIKHHTSRQNFYDWYAERVNTPGELLDGATTLLCFETPFYPEIVREAQSRGITTVLMPMYECTSDGIANLFDVIITPSLLDQDTFQRGVHIPVPVPNGITWRERTRARVFVHNAGHGGLSGRNGTKELLEAMEYVKSPIKLIIRSQSPEIHSSDPRVEIVHGTVPFEELWSDGDVFVFPEKFNGLSLPIQEAYASGMLVMASDRYPSNTYLPREPLIHVSGYTQEMLARQIYVATIRPQDIAAKIDEFYDADITEYSHKGLQYKKEHSWKKLKKRYAMVLK